MCGSVVNLIHVIDIIVIGCFRIFLNVSGMLWLVIFIGSGRWRHMSALHSGSENTPRRRPQGAWPLRRLLCAAFRANRGLPVQIVEAFLAACAGALRT
jgi:hypothetical protein